MRKFFGLIIFALVCFALSIAQAGIVEPVYKQFKSPNLDNEDDNPSTVSVRITPDGKKVFAMSHLRKGQRTGEADFITSEEGDAIYIYNLTTPFDISTMDVTNRIVVDTNNLGDDLGGNGNQKKIIEFFNNGSQVFIVQGGGDAQLHNLSSPYDLASISTSTIVINSQGSDIDFFDRYIRNTGNDAAEHSVSSANGANLFDFDFSNDGTRMYITNAGKNNSTNTNFIYQVKLSTPFDPSTGADPASEAVEHIFDASPQLDYQTTELEFDDDGTRMYLLESQSNPTLGAGNHAQTHMYVYKLSDPFNLASATYIDKYAVSPGGVLIGSYSFTFGNNGMKLYIATEDETSDASIEDDVIFEYDLTCPYGVVICENETATATSAQVEIAKNVIYQNSNTIFKRFDWLRRNEEKANLNSHNIKLNINNPILASLKNKLEQSLNNNLADTFEYTQASLKDKNPFKNIRNWSHWSHGDISFGRVGEKGFIKPKDIRAKGIMIGADKLVNNKIFGLAFRYGNDIVKIDTGAGSKLDSDAFTLNLYGSLPLQGKSNINALIGASFLSIDQLIKNTVTGERYGRQIFTSLTYQNENEYTNYDLIPFGKFELGITQLSEYTDFGTSATNSVDVHERLTFKTGNISGGLKFDDILYLDNKTLSRNGFVEYIYELTPDIDHFYKNHSDNTTVRKTIKKHSLHNIRGNIGFEYINVNGYTFAINYERFQSLSNGAYSDSLLFKLGKKQVHQANFDVIYDPTNNNKTEISYLKNLGNFKLKIDTNYSLFSKIPDYGANLEISGTF